MAGFRGIFEHSLDNRGRLAVPARYRDAFADGGVLVPSADGCLELYPSDSYDETAQSLTAENRNHRRARRLRRAVFARSWDLELDRQGRILIPQALREQVHLGGNAVIVGGRECVEIWDSERWAQELAEVEREFATDLETLDATPS